MCHTGMAGLSAFVPSFDSRASRQVLEFGLVALNREERLVGHQRAWFLGYLTLNTNNFSL